MLEEFVEFEQKIKEILEKHNHIKSEDWKNICYAIFLEYRHEKYLVEQLKMRDVF